MLKSFIITYVADFDLVIFALFLACVDVVIQIAAKRRPPSSLFLLAFLTLMCFYVYISFSLFYSESNGYAYTKAMNFVPNIVFFTYGFALRKINMKLFIKGYCLVLIPLAFFFIYMKSIVWQIDSDATRTFKDLRNNYLAIGLHLGILLFICYYYYKKIWLMVILFFLLLASSARAALLFTVFVFVLFEFRTILAFKIKKKILLFGMATAVFIFGLIIVLRDKVLSLLENSLNRIGILFSGNDKSSMGRIDAMSFAWDESFSSIGTFMFGNGVGSFGIMYLGVDGRAYPHNLFLEVLFEFGFLGIILIAIILILAFKSALSGKKVILVLFVFCFLNAMKSSNLTDLWILFSIMGISLNQNKILIPNRL